MAASGLGGHKDDRLVDLIYDAAFDDALWPGVLERLGDRAGGHASNLLQLNIVDGHGFGITARTPDDMISRYFAQWAQRNPIGLPDDPFDYRRDWSPRITRDEECIDRRALERTPYWNEFLAPIGVHYMIHLRLSLCGDDLTTIGLSRPAHHRPFDDDDIAALVPFHRHLIRAERMWRSLGLRQAQFDQFEALLAASSEAMLFLDDGFRPLRWSPAAEALLGAGGALRIAGGRLHATDATTDVDLRRALTLALGGGAPRPVTVGAARRGEAITLSVARLGERGAAGITGTRCLLVVARPSEDAAGALRALFGLTSAEAALALALKDGETLRAVAARRGLSINTIRNQLAAVFDKTGCRRQQDLVRMLATRRA